MRGHADVRGHVGGCRRGDQRWRAGVRTAVAAGVTAAAAGLLAVPAGAAGEAGVGYGWGNNHYGQLGDISSPGTVPAAGPLSDLLSDVTAVAGGGVSAYALRADGTVWAWGRNDFGQLGNGTTVDSSTPVRVSGLTSVTAVAGGGVSGYALRSDGTVWAWGRGDFGQLGNGAAANSSTPVQVSGLTGVTAISAGAWTGYALRTGGTMYAWGHNAYGQLGNGTTTNAAVPMAVPGLPPIDLIAGGRWNGYAHGVDGTLWSWGANWSNQAGRGPYYAPPELSPGLVSHIVGELDDVVGIASGGETAYVWRADGVVLAWGDNTYGQAGANYIGYLVGQPQPVTGLSSVVSVAAGGDSAYALLADGTVRAWGRGDLGQLGNGSLSNTNVPAVVPGLTGVTAIGAGGYSGYAVVGD